MGVSKKHLCMFLKINMEDREQTLHDMCVLCYYYPQLLSSLTDHGVSAANAVMLREHWTILVQVYQNLSEA